MDKVQKSLLRFGLTVNEAKIYRAALKHEESSPYILSKATGVPRTTVYEIVMSLSLKGLIGVERSDGLTKQQTRIRAKNPSELRSILHKKRTELTEIETDIVSILPELKGDYHKQEANADFEFFPGIEGAKKVYFNETHEEIDLQSYAWDYQMPMDAFGMETTNEDVAKSIDLQIKARYKPKVLLPLNDWTRHVMAYQYGRDRSYIKYCDYRFIDNPVWKLKQRISIKGNRIRITNVENGEVWGLIINSQSLAKSLESMFQLMWVTAVPVTDEVIRNWGENEFLKAEKKKTKRK